MSRSMFYKYAINRLLQEMNVLTTKAKEDIDNDETRAVSSRRQNSVSQASLRRATADYIQCRCGTWNSKRRNTCRKCGEALNA
jgi:ribosomal protein L40E